MEIRPTALSGRTRIRFKGEMALPGNNEYTILLDTTRGLPDNVGNVSETSSALPDPGTVLGQALGRIYGIAVSSADQDVTLLRYGLHGDGTWQQAATTTVTAGAAPQAVNFDPSLQGYEDALIVVKAGGTAPGHVYASLTEITKP